MEELKLKDHVRYIGKDIKSKGNRGKVIIPNGAEGRIEGVVKRINTNELIDRPYYVVFDGSDSYYKDAFTPDELELIGSEDKL